MALDSRVIKRMNALVIRAQLAVCHILLPHPDKRDDRSYKISAAVANELFGKSPKPDHIELFGEDKIRKAARTAVESGHDIKALVVQSLRVTNVIRIRHELEPLRMDVLKEFGKEFPDAPTPDNFEVLVTEFEEAHGIEHRLMSEMFY